MDAWSDHARRRFAAANRAVSAAAARASTLIHRSAAVSPHAVLCSKQEAALLSAPRSPELALGTHGILGPHLHAVEGGAGIRRGGQVAAHHLVLVVLEVALLWWGRGVGAGELLSMRNNGSAGCRCRCGARSKPGRAACCAGCTALRVSGPRTVCEWLSSSTLFLSLRSSWRAGLPAACSSHQEAVLVCEGLPSDSAAANGLLTPHKHCTLPDHGLRELRRLAAVALQLWLTAGALREPGARVCTNAHLLHRFCYCSASAQRGRGQRTPDFCVSGGQAEGRRVIAKWSGKRGGSDFTVLKMNYSILAAGKWRPRCLCTRAAIMCCAAACLGVLCCGPFCCQVLAF